MVSTANPELLKEHSVPLAREPQRGFAMIKAKTTRSVKSHSPHEKNNHLPTPPMSSPESSSPPPGGHSVNSVNSPDIIPQEVLQSISKVALVKNFNRRQADEEIKERRQLEKLNAELQAAGIEKKSTEQSTKEKTSKLSQLEDVDEYQRRIEQDNSQRKLLLAQAVLDRERRTVAEVRRLNKIKKELERLDNILSSDVAILRKEIEVASIEFNEAEKNYCRIEKEFIEAKYLLHNKLDRKEKLTEHLCFIIEENELRKARKLQQLMDDLNVDALREDYQMLPVFDQEEICNSCGNGFPEGVESSDETTKIEAASQS